MKLSRLYRDQRGVTLIDLILVIIIVAIAIPPMVGVFITSTRNSTFGVTMARANHLASNLFEEIRSKRWDENVGAASATLGPETGENRATYDDVDDFHGLNETPPEGLPGRSHERLRRIWAAGIGLLCGKHRPGHLPRVRDVEL